MTTKTTSPNPDTWAAASVLVEAAIGWGILMAALVAMASTRAYPIAYGIVGLALLYYLLLHSDKLAGLFGWAESKAT